MNRGSSTRISFEVFRKRKALNMFFAGGFPSLNATAALLKRLPKLGCDIIEVGIPYSDPLADGPVIRQAYGGALKKQVTPEKVMRVIAKVRKDVPVPVVLLIYENLILRTGEERFIRKMTEYGINGVIVPDMLFPFYKDFASKCRAAGVAFIPLVSPKTPLERVKEISASGDGFLYYVNVEGVTGERNALPSDIRKRLEKVRRASKLPVLSGFGISTPAQVKRIKSCVDGVIVGSALQKRINAGKKIDGFVRSMKCSL